MRIATRLTALALVLALATLPATANAGKKKKKLFKAKVGGITLHAIKPGIAGALFTNNVGFTITGAGHKRFTVQQLTLACATPGGPAAGGTYTCGGAFAQTNARKPGSTKGWVTDDQVVVTVTAFDGSYIAGTISGQLERPGDTNPGDPPASITGKFSVPLY
jgi:hypothetical protein